MKKTCSSRAAFFDPRLLIVFALCSSASCRLWLGQVNVTGMIAPKAPAQTPGLWRRRAAWLRRDTSYGDVAAQRQGARRWGTYASSLSERGTYDPATGLWTATGSLATARRNHTATLLPNGKVLVAGGYNDASGSLASAELYDPASGAVDGDGQPGYRTISITRRPCCPTARCSSQADLTAATGSRERGTLRSGDRDCGRRRAALATARYDHTGDASCPTAKCSSLAGFDGNYLASAELYDPASGLWTRDRQPGCGHDSATPRRCCPTARCSSLGDLTTSAVLSRARNSTIRRAGLWSGDGQHGRPRETAIRRRSLPNGKVLVAGGYEAAIFLASAELYEPASGLWTATEQPRLPRDTMHYGDASCPTARCSSLAGTWRTLTFWRARNST